MRKGISPLISWILLVGMAVSIGSLVSIYLINLSKAQGESIGGAQLENLYCPDVAIEGTGLCYILTQGSNGVILRLDLKNKGFFSITNISLVIKLEKKDGGGERTIEKGKFEYYIPDNSFPLGPDPNIIVPLSFSLINDPLTQVGVPNNGEDFTPVNNPLNEIAITPMIKKEDKLIVCNGKVFKLQTSSMNIPIC